MKRALGILLWSSATLALAAPGLTITGLNTGETHRVNELGRSLAVSVALEDPPTADVTIALSASVAGQVQFVPGTSLTITAANPSEVKNFVVRGLDNATVAANPDFNVVLTTTSTDPDYNGMTKTFAFTNENNEAETDNQAPSAVVVIAPSMNATGLKNSSKYVIELPFDSDKDPLTLTLCRDTADDFSIAPQCADFAESLTARRTESSPVSLAAVSILILASLFWSGPRKHALLLVLLATPFLFGCGSEKLVDSFNIKPRPRWSVEMTGLDPSTLYYWKAFVSDGHGNIVQSSVRSFTSGVTP